MTILDKISAAAVTFANECGIQPTHLYLGNLERRAFIAACEAVLGWKPEHSSLVSCKLVYNGMILIPVDTPSYLSVGAAMSSTDESLR